MNAKDARNKIFQRLCDTSAKCGADYCIDKMEEASKEEIEKTITAVYGEDSNCSDCMFSSVGGEFCELTQTPTCNAAEDCHDEVDLIKEYVINKMVEKGVDSDLINKTKQKENRDDNAHTRVGVTDNVGHHNMVGDSACYEDRG